MKRNNLIADVAVSFIRTRIKKETKGTLRFCLLGFEDSIIVSIAMAVLKDRELSDSIEVKISSQFDSEGCLPLHSVSDQSITHWRHCRLPEGKRAVLFAASHKELQRNDKSVEKVTKIETDTLRALYCVWIEKSGLTAAVLDDIKHRNLETALQAANETHVARTIEAFSDFVLAIADGFLLQYLPIQDAVDNALPGLRLPSYSGEFDRIPKSKRAVKSEWSKRFRRLHSRTRPLLVQENEKGERISEQLKENFRDICDRLNDTERSVILEFLDDDLTIDGWTESQKKLVELDWRRISELFRGVEKTSSASLGAQTIKFFEDEFNDLLDEEEKNLLGVNFPKEPSDDLREFFEAHREHIARDKKLSSNWEKYIYRNPQTYNDFLAGIVATLHFLRERTEDREISEKKIVISIPRGYEKSFWRNKNARVVRYFAFRYKGLESLLGENIFLDFGKLEEFYFPVADPELSKITSRSREARTIKFEMVLDPEGAKSKLIFYWEMPPSALSASMADDLRYVANIGGVSALLATADITRQSTSAKGSIQRISLEDVTTIRDVDNKNDGRLVAPNTKTANLSEGFCECLENISDILTPAQSADIREAFEVFVRLYTSAVRDWVSEDGKGIASEVFIEQVEAYERLLRSLIEGANNDRAREELWTKIFRLGVANVEAGDPAAVVVPWHPLRLAEIHVKARQTAELISRVLEAEENDISRADLLFSQVQAELLTNYYPEVCVGFGSGEPMMLSATDTMYGYTLYESPRRGIDMEGEDALDIDPTAAAQAFSRVGEQYLDLLPHERSNFSIVLYNAESKALPAALASELSTKVEQEDELQCDLFLTHSDPKRMRRIYEQQNVAVSEEAGFVMASEVALNFLSRLRVGFLEASDIEENDIASAADLVVLQDSVARNAQVVWKRAPGDQHPELIQHKPTRWSRKKPVSRADSTTAVYLAAPSQPLVGQTYLNAVHIYIKGDNALSDDVIPAREANFRDSEVEDILRHTHSIGEWVVNFDEIVDRRLLKNKGVQVIRHIHDRNVGRNIIVSTKSKPRLLYVLLRERLDRLDPGIILDCGKEVVDRLISQVNELSGQVVLRAARYGHYANELLGIVLSMEQIKVVLRHSPSLLPIGWYFLDDFASWFGQREDHIADIMAIAPQMENGCPVLVVVVSEAKYITSEGYRSQARKSAKQLEETVDRIERALNPERKRIDKDIWLHHLGDLIIEGMEEFDAAQLGGWDLHKLSHEVRQDRVPIRLAGFSHVFVCDDDEYVDAKGPTPLKGISCCAQQIFDKKGVADALRYFSRGELPQSTDSFIDFFSSRGAGEEMKSHFDNGNWPEAKEPNIFVVGGEEGTTGILDLGGVETALDDRTAGNDSVAEKNSSGPGADGENVGVDRKILNRWPSDELASWVEQKKVSSEENAEDKEWLERTARSLQHALRSYDMTAQLVGSHLTPNAALIRFRGSDDLTVPKVEKRNQELLTTHAIEVINVLAAPKEVIIMVARENRAILRLRDLWRRRGFPESTPYVNTSLLLGGRESDGEIVYLNVDDEFGGYCQHGPHTLIAGETGSGKGVLVQCLLLDICATNSPSNARIVMIDPKAGIDFPWLRRMPHLEGDLITDREDAITTFEWLVEEMERRYRLFTNVGATKLSSYNRKVEVADRLPRIWLFHDELAGWMMIDEYRDAVELSANHLGLKARAAGINLVLVTQRPDKEALPMQLRANLTNRLVLKVADKKNSMLVLDEPGAERLLGRGHLAAKLSGEKEVMLVQVPYASGEEMVELAELIQSAWEKRQ